MCLCSSALYYNVALTFYSLKNYPQALKYIAEIIERGIKEHPGENLEEQHVSSHPFFLLTGCAFSPLQS